MIAPDQTIKFVMASADDGDELADLRVEVMRPSLEAAGLLDMARARRRFLDAFDPKATQKILRGGELVGFYVVREFEDHLYLDNLYLKAKVQGQGIGSMIIKMVKEQASQRAVPIRLTALIDSDANDFYIRHGFRLFEVSEFDNHYEFIAD